MQEVNVMVSHASPTLRNKKGKNQATNSKSENYAAVPAEDERIYGIDHLNLGENKNDLEDDSGLENESEHADKSVIEPKWLLTQHREVNITNKKT